MYVQKKPDLVLVMEYKTLKKGGDNMPKTCTEKERDTCQVEKMRL